MFCLFYRILYNAVSLTTVVQILAVYVLLPSSESVGTHCANVFNAQHGYVQNQSGGIVGPQPLENHKLHAFL